MEAEKTDRKKHWENIYQTKELKDVSWFQPTPETSLSFFYKHNVPANAKIIDVGGGDSHLVDHLLDLGYEDITVLDISEAAIHKAKARLGTKAEKVKWIVSDVVSFTSEETYDVWHDRATFHFLTDEKDIATYVQTAKRSVSTDGIMVIGTFSDQGPQKCSGITIKQYTEQTMTATFAPYFDKINCFTVDHKTPSDAIQNFVFCSFKRKS